MANYQPRSGQTLEDIAREYLGNANLWREISGWAGNPGEIIPPGNLLTVPSGVYRIPAAGPTDTGPPSGDGDDLTGTGAASNAPTADQMKRMNSALSAGALDEIKNEVETFMATIGFDPRVNAQQLMYMIFDHGLWAQPEAAYQLLYSQLPTDILKANPWAQFGLDSQTYHDRAAKLQTAWFEITGQGALPKDLLGKAIFQNWTLDQLQRAATNDPAIAASNPWLASGETFIQAKESYMSSYGQAPQNPQTLAGWFRFTQAAKQTRGATTQFGLAPQTQQRQASQSEIR